MGNLANIQPVWEPNIFQIETNDPVIGGVPNAGTGAGTNNIAPYQLANRTEYLKAGLDTAKATLDSADPFPIYLTNARGDVRYYTQAQVDALIASAGLPAGAVLWYAAATVPSAEWLVMDGSLISRTAYSNLFAKIGTTFSVGDGATTFGLPNAMGEFIRGWDNGRGIDTGRAFGSFQPSSIGPHTHDTTGRARASDTGTGQLRSFPYPGGGALVDYIDDVGTGIGTDTYGRNIALLPIIKH